MNLHNDPAKLLVLCYHGSPVEVACTWCADEVNQIEHLLMGELGEAFAYCEAVIADRKLAPHQVRNMKIRVGGAAIDLLLLAEAIKSGKGK